MTQITLQDVFAHELKDMYDAEQQILRALPKMISAATDEQLHNSLGDHLVETQDHVRRLEEVGSNLGIVLTGERCPGMAGIITESEKMLTMDASPEVQDVLIIAGALRVEHYEVAGYRALITLASVLEYAVAEDLLTSNLEEDEAAADILESAATGGLFSKGLTEKAADSELDSDITD